jgi:hypothetical protein
MIVWLVVFQVIDKRLSNLHSKRAKGFSSEITWLEWSCEGRLFSSELGVSLKKT